jgi:hypothetical protein
MTKVIDDIGFAPLQQVLRAARSCERIFPFDKFDVAVKRTCGTPRNSSFKAQELSLSGMLSSARGRPYIQNRLCAGMAQARGAGKGEALSRVRVRRPDARLVLPATISKSGRRHE